LLLRHFCKRHWHFCMPMAFLYADGTFARRVSDFISDLGFSQSGITLS